MKENNMIKPVTEKNLSKLIKDSIKKESQVTTTYYSDSLLVDVHVTNKQNSTTKRYH